MPPPFFLLFLLLLLFPLTAVAQFAAEPQTVARIRDILERERPISSVFRSDPGVFIVDPEPQASIPAPSTIRFAPTSIRITHSKEVAPTEEDEVRPHEWSKMTVFVRSGSGSPTLNDALHRVLSTWIRTTKGQMYGGFTSTTTTPVPMMLPPPGQEGDVIEGPPLPPGPATPPPTEFVDRADVFTTKPPKAQVFDARMPTIVEGWPLGGEFIRANPLTEDDENEVAPPESFEELLKICPIYPETATMFIHQVVKREYSAGFETRVQCRCGTGSHEAFFARKSKPLLTDQPASLDPAFLSSDLIVARFSCAFPGNICVRTENGINLRSMDWQTHVYPAVGSGGGWANSFILLMENGTKLEDADSGKIYLGASQFDGDKRKSRLEHSYLRIKSISCDGCTRELACQR